MNFSSKHIEEAINEFAKLPGVGRKTATRYVLHVLRQETKEVEAFVNSIVNLRNELKYCSVCHNISDKEVCSICSNHNRDKTIVCVVEDIRDVMAIESTQQYKGMYHVLGGIISPLDGIGPNDLNIESLVKRISSGENGNSIKEIIMALSTTMEGDTTNFYIYKRLKDFNLTMTTIARGISIGDELEYTDEITLGRSITNRVPYENVLPIK
ncbi:MAG: recombination protein RecR [Bacteroidetes bacterium]|nr:recombination protein RecR [Bacteroidota bacterium]